MVALFVAATVVTLMQLYRTRERRLLALAALFVCLALAHSREDWDPWKQRFHLLAGGAGLVLLVMLSRQPPQPPRPSP
jgi:hypothetical protein